MPKVFVPYYSSYGHVEALAEAVANGAPTRLGGSQRQPGAIDLAGAYHQGEVVARTAAKLFA